MTKVIGCEDCPLFIEYRSRNEHPHELDKLTDTIAPNATKNTKMQNRRVSSAIFQGLVSGRPTCPGIKKRTFRGHRIAGAYLGDDSIRAGMNTCKNPFAQSDEFFELTEQINRGELTKVDKEEKAALGLSLEEYPLDEPIRFRELSLVSKVIAGAIAAVGILAVIEGLQNHH